MFFVGLPALIGQTGEEYKAFISHWEGVRYVKYKDSLGHWTVGVGHKLLNNEIKDEYTHEDIEKFWKTDFKRAHSDAGRLFGPLENYPVSIRLILVDLSFNLGYSGLGKFTRFRAAIASRDYKSAAKELENSLWAKQVGRRATNHINTFKNL